MSHFSSFTIRALPWALLLAFPVFSHAAGAPASGDDAAHPLPTVTVKDSKLDTPSMGSTVLNADALQSVGVSDATRLLGDIPGVSFYGAGGVSSLPVVHGLADDRLRIKVDGMDLISACANHMNPPLSYIDPTDVGSIQVFTGITPVSAGGDSIGGSIQVNSQPPVFARAGEGVLTKGTVGAFYRSNGNGRGGNVSLTMASDKLSVTYSGATTQASNYDAAQDFKAAIPATASVAVPGAKEVGSSQFLSKNQSLGMALRLEDQQIELRLGQQNIPYQGFPNQRMDMTRNNSDQVNLRYLGQTRWGAVDARVYSENTRHTMNFLDNKLSAVGSLGMPMDTEGKNTGVVLKADVVLSARDTLKVGSEIQQYRLNDWWDPISATPGGMMSPNTFWNIRDGQRDRADVFGEWDARWSPQWQSQVGLRSSTITMNTGKVQGYSNTGMMGYGDPDSAASVPGAFNALDHKKTDNNVDFSALARFAPDTEKSLEFGYARKTRSPNLYERFAWSTNNNMVMNMINWAGDANGYVGNINLKPEVANTLSATASWHDAERKLWGVQVTPYFTYVEDYIDGVACAAVGKTCPARTDSFVNLSFANQSARIYGLDVSGNLPVARVSNAGTFVVTGMLSYTKGKNASTDDNLYNIMPLNAKLALVHKLGSWKNTIESQLVSAKTDVSATRNETQTAGYGLLNLRSSYEWQAVRFDLGIENALDKFYTPPLGGAYYGQRGAVWGIPVSGAGRSLYAGVTVKF